MNLKLWYGLGLAGLLGLVGLGSASLGGMEPMTSPLPGGETSVTSPPTPELQTFTAGGHVLGFAPRYLLTASGHHGFKVEFLNAQPVIPQSDTPAATSQGLPAPPLTQVRYPNLWPGIDLSYRAAPGGIVESLYRLQPGADINQVRLRYNRPLSLNADGRLSIRFDTGVLNESAPIAWQEVDGQRQAVSVAFVQHKERELGFTLGEHDPTRPLWIDPTLSWNTFLGGSDQDRGFSIAVDGDGNIYVAGSSDATWGSPLRAYTDAGDAFVAKLDSQGTLLWHTFLGGGYPDAGSALALDPTGQVFLCGYSFASWGTPIRSHKGGYGDAFVAKLDSQGALLWHTFVGGDGGDGCADMALDASGKVYVIGTSDATWGNPIRAFAFNGLSDAFVAKLDSQGALLWHTFLGGGDPDVGTAIALDSGSHAYITGESFGTWGNPLRAFNDGGPPNIDAFVAKLDPQGALAWNTFLGGGFADSGAAIALDRGGHVYITGESFGTWGDPIRAYSLGTCAQVAPFPPCPDAFVAKLDASGGLLWNTFMGGTALDSGADITLDDKGDLYMVGSSSASWGTPLQGFHEGTCGTGAAVHSCYDVFVARLDPNGALIWNSFEGGSEDEWGGAIALDANVRVFVTGVSTTSWGHPVRAYSGSFDAFVTKLSLFSQIDLSGVVSLFGTDIPVCALVLANGQSRFSCDGEGHFALKSVPIDSHDQVTLYSWADGFDPYQLVFTPASASEAVDVAMRVSPCQGPDGGTTTQHSSLPKVNLSGQVSLAGSDTPVCALVLANGQSQFSCGGDGHYVLDGVPTDSNGQVTLFAWAEGFFPYKVVFAPFSIVETRDLPMTPDECGD